MKNIVKNLLQRIGEVAFGPMHRELKRAIIRNHHAVAALQRHVARSSSTEAQVALFYTYRNMANRQESPLPGLDEVGFRCYSQFEEDGILLYIFGMIGTTNKICVEIGSGDGIECNTANLIVNHGWWGYLFDGDEKSISSAKQFYESSKHSWLYPPRAIHAWFTADNINSVVSGAGVEGEIDLLSLDIDGMDYWTWKALDCIKPRVVVCETHGIIGPEDALTVPYDPEFRISTPDHHGASLAAMTKLAQEKGYRLIGTHRYGFNAFFVRNDIGENLLPAVTPASCLRDPYTVASRADRWPKVKDLEWVRV
jgi:hypothetical protein